MQQSQQHQSAQCGMRNQVSNVTNTLWHQSEMVAKIVRLLVLVRI